MNVVEIDQKKALLIKFAKREPVRSTLDQIQGDTSETVQILKSISGGFKQIPSADVSPIMRSAESAAPTVFSPQIAVPAPVIITKETAAPSPKAVKHSKPIKLQKKGSVAGEAKAKEPAKTQIALPAEKAVDRTIDKKTTKKPQKTGVKVQPAQKAQPATEKESKPSPKEDLTEERRTKGLFKGLSGIFTKAFKREDKDRKDLVNTEDAKETGMLALLGPLAPAIQEVKSLAGERDKDEPGRISKMIGLFRKKKPDEDEETKEKPAKKAKGTRDEKGRFIPKELPAQKVEASKEVPEKLDIIHDDLVESDKDQEKRDKKLMRAVAAGGAASGGGILDMLSGGKRGRTKGVPGTKKPGLFGRIFRGGKAAKVTGVAGKVGPFARAGGAITKLLGPLGGFVKILGKIAAPLAVVMGIFDGVMGWGKAAEISGKKEKDVTTGDKVQAAASSVLSGLTLGLVETKTIYKGIESATSVFKSKKKPGAEESEKKYDPYSRYRGYSRPAMGAIPKKSTPNLKGTLGAWGSRARKIPVTEDRNPRIARKDKELQNQIDASNKNLITESKKTNELLKKLLEKKSDAPTVTKDNHIPNGITNRSDVMSIKGDDED